VTLKLAQTSVAILRRVDRQSPYRSNVFKMMPSHSTTDGRISTRIGALTPSMKNYYC